MKLTLFLLVSALIMACSNGQKRDNPVNETEVSISKFVYEFTDSSVPPEYHRSYVLTVTKKEIHVVVDSYGNVLTDTTIEISEEDFSGLCRSFEKAKIEECDDPNRNDCDGGTMHELEVFDKSGEKYIEGYMYWCAAEPEGTLCGDLFGFADEIKKMIPDFTALLKEDYFDENEESAE